MCLSFVPFFPFPIPFPFPKKRMFSTLLDQKSQLLQNGALALETWKTARDQCKGLEPAEPMLMGLAFGVLNGSCGRGGKGREGEGNRNASFTSPSMILLTNNRAVLYGQFGILVFHYFPLLHVMLVNTIPFPLLSSLAVGWY